MTRPPLTALICIFVYPLVACGPVGPRDVRGTAPPAETKPVLEDKRALAQPAATRLVAVERGSAGSRLVLVDEAGLRQRVLTDVDGGSLDLMPAWSPDGRWIVFASSRERGEPVGQRFSLWIVRALTPGATPTRLTHEAAVDWTPTWTPDGAAIVFASTGTTGSFDLYRLELQDDGDTRTPGRLTRLTESEGEEKDPSLSPDGTQLAYTRVDGSAHQIVVAGADGTKPRALAEGIEPSWSPDGEWLAYVAPTQVRNDLDVWRIDASGKGRAVLVDDDIADEHTPRFAADGCFVLATSLLRDESGRVVTSSLVVTPICKPSGAWQALIELHPTPRLGFALAPVPLRAEVLAGAPGYKAALKRSLAPAVSPDRDDE